MKNYNFVANLKRALIISAAIMLVGVACLAIFGVELVLPGMIVCRGISYYTQLVISGVMTGVAQFVFREKMRK